VLSVRAGGLKPHLVPVVRLLSRDGSERAHALADSLGCFRLAPPEDGEYPMEAVRLGDETACTPLLPLQRTNSAEAVRRCALVVLNGSLISRERAIMIDPESIEAMAILVPREAATLYGSMGGVGAVLIWTKRGG
jgi:hypothetical protein